MRNIDRIRQMLLEELAPMLICDQIESIEEDNSSVSKSFDIDNVLEQLEDYGKYKGLLRCEGEGFENYIPVSIAKQIVRGRGLGKALGYMEEYL